MWVAPNMPHQPCLPQDWRAVEALKGRAPPPLPLAPLPLRVGGPPADRVQAEGRARRPALAADVAQIVDTVLAHTTATSSTSAAGQPGPAAPPGCVPSAAASRPASSSTGLAACLEVLAAPDALALATDTTLTTLLNGLHPLLHYSAAARQWGTPSLGALLAALQASCEVGADDLWLIGRKNQSRWRMPDVWPPVPAQLLPPSAFLTSPALVLPFRPAQERLRRTTLPCDSALAAAAARLFVHVAREAGSAALGDGLLTAAAGFVMSQSRCLSAEVGAGRGT